MASSPGLTLTQVDQIARLRFNRPLHANTLDSSTALELVDLLAEVTESSALALLLEGNEQFFCAGGDLGSFAESNIASSIEKTIIPLHDAIRHLLNLPMPSIAVVRGAAAGAGVSLASATDLAIASESARFKLAYSAVGLTPDGGGSWFLPRLVGSRRAAELFLLNRTLSAREALEWGLVNEVIADDAIEARAIELARQLAAGPTSAFVSTRLLAFQGWTNSLSDHLDREEIVMQDMARTADARSRIKSFLEKS